VAQQAHFESLLRAQWDADFIAARRRAGEVHAELEVDPELFLGAYNQYAQFFVNYFAQTKRAAQGAEQDDFDWLFSLIKAIFLDIGLTLDAYFARSTRALEQALSLYWRANEELRRFAQLTSHDLKTPLATVANRCEEALDEFGEAMPEGARDLIGQAHRGVFRMSRLIDELLASTIVQHEEDSNAIFDCQDAIEGAVERIQPLLERQSIQLSLPASYPQVWGNPVRLREAVYNLLSNAAKFIRHPQGRIRIDFQINPNDCVLTVQDNGPGIPSEELDRVFVPFRRLPMHRSEPGSGLGLYFTKNLVETMGGTVWAESELGEGSRFRIRLRRSPPSESPARARVK
jgi:signal transduction histidine kinase